jgi:hypothetical protein
MFYASDLLSLQVMTRRLEMPVSLATAAWIALLND